MWLPHFRPNAPPFPVLYLPACQHMYSAHVLGSVLSALPRMHKRVFTTIGRDDCGGWTCDVTLMSCVMCWPAMRCLPVQEHVQERSRWHDRMGCFAVVGLSGLCTQLRSARTLSSGHDSCVAAVVDREHTVEGSHYQLTPFCAPRQKGQHACLHGATCTMMAAGASPAG